MTYKHTEAFARWRELEEHSRETRKRLLASITQPGPLERNDGLDQLREETYKAFADSEAALQVFKVAARIDHQRELRIRESLASIGVQDHFTKRTL